MTLISFYTLLLHVLIGLGIVVFSVADERPEMAVLATPVVIFAYAVRRREWSFGLPTWLLNMLLVGVTLWALATASWALDQTVSEIAQYIMLVQLLRLFETPSSRKWAQEIGLSAMLVLAAALTNVALNVGLLIFLYSAVLLTTVLAHQVCVGAWRHREAGAERLPVSSASVTRPMRRDFARIAIAATAIVVLCATAVFVVMPRGIGKDMFFDISNEPSGRTITDFNDSVTLGEQGRITESSAPVMRVTLTGHTGNPPFLMRGVTLDSYDPKSHSWRRSEEQRNRAETPPDSLRLTDDLWTSLEPRQAVARVELLRVRSRYLFSLAHAREAAFPQRVAYEITPSDGVVRIDDTDDLESGGQYSILSDRPGSADPVPTPLDPSLAEPFERTSVPAIARGILAEAGVDFVGFENDHPTPPPGFRREATEAFTTYLRNEFTYTLDQVAPPLGTDPLTYFLTDSRQGHCEYFASSLAALCRSVGIHARMVTGYVVYDDTGGASVTGAPMTVRQSNAHAWTEVELAPGHWREYDASPPAGVASVHVPARGLAGMYQKFKDSIQIAWSKYVVNYDDQQQEKALETASGGAFADFGGIDERIQAIMDMPRGRLFTLAVRSLAIGLFAFASVYGMITGLRALVRWLSRQRRTGRAWRTHTDSGRAVERAYRGMLRSLERAGAGKPEWRPPSQHLSTLDSLADDTRASARTITDLYYRAVFSGADTSETDARNAREALDRFRETLNGVRA